jgi:hypothetical protein
MTASSKYQILKLSKPIFNASNRAGSGSGPFGDKFQRWMSVRLNWGYIGKPIPDPESGPGTLWVFVLRIRANHMLPASKPTSG